MTTIQLLSTLRRLGIELAIDGDEIVCRAQPGVFTDDLRRALAERKSEVMAFLRHARASRAAARDRIEPLNPDARFELSPAQQRLWFLDRWRPAGGLYNIAEAFRLKGVIDFEALNAAVACVVRRQEVLRTRFVEEDGRPRAVVEEPVDHGLVVIIDLRHLPPEERVARAALVLRDVAQRPFDLSRAPLLRMTLIRIEEAVADLVIALPHIISDAWSIGVLSRELSTYYRGLRTGTEATLPPLPIQYRDYAAWQLKQLNGPRLDEDLRYWRDKLAGVPILEVPADRTRPAIRGPGGALASVAVPRAVRQALEALARSEGVTIFMLLLAAFLALLRRYTGEDDVAVGTVMTQRNRPELDALIGLFVNTLVLRTDLSGDPPFHKLLGRVRDVALEAYEHRDVPFDRLVAELKPTRDLQQTPLCQVMFVHQRAQATALAFDDIGQTPLGADNGGAKFDLTITVTEWPEELGVTVEYATDLFSAETIERLLGHYTCLLESIVAAPSTQLSKLSLMRADERTRLLSEWAGPPICDGPAIDLVTAFARAARVHAPRIAVTHGEQTISYAALDAGSTRLARYLRGLGVGPEVCVGLCVEPSIELVLAILAILKAGGAYVALDPALPDARLRYMSEDARVGVVVTDAGGDRRRDAFGAARVVSLADQAWRAASGAAPPDAIDPEQLAYVLYTSGSTGVPKGVGVTHRNVTRLLEVTQAWGGFSADDVWALFHSYGFDVSVWEIWGALLFGGRLLVVPYWIRRSPGELHALLRASGVTVLNQTPSAFRQLRAHGGSWRELAVRLVICAGEELRYAELTDWSTTGVRLVNMYGITETTVHVTRCEVGAAELSGTRGSVIGGPLTDLRMYVLDAAMQPVPPGVPGELYVGGRGVARGYIGRARLTASRFVPDPFGGEPGARLYRSGDVVRYLGDGEFAYLGRADRQVKIRGHRLELGEVEAALLGAGVREAVVEHRVDGAGLDRLVAYVVGDEQAADALRTTLAARLPVYMLPVAYVWLERLPLTAHGKVDRRALPAAAAERPELATAYTAPRSATEAALAAIWRTVLRLDRIGVHDSFFSLGGDSIRSLQVQALAARRSLPFSLEQLFRHPTIAALAAAIATPAEAPPPPRTEPFALLDPAERDFPPDIEDAYPLTQLQAGMLYHITLAPYSNIYHNTDSFPVRLPAPFQPAHFINAVAHVVDRHAALRTSFLMTAPRRPLQLVHRHAQVAVQVRDLRDLDPARTQAVIDALIEREKLRRFDPSRPGLLRIYAHVLSDTAVQLTITECHAILDGWSWHSTLVEILDTYTMLANARAIPAPVPPDASRPTFRDYVALEQQALTCPTFSAFWRDQLKYAPSPDIVGARTLGAEPRSPDHDPLIRSVSLMIDPSVQADLRRLCVAAGVGIRTLFLAAHVRTLALFTRQDEVVTGLQVNGRPEGVDADDLRGLFLNLLPFRITVARESWTALIEQAFALEQAIFPFRRYPLAQIIRENGGRTFFQTAFNFLDFHVLGKLPNGFEIGEGRRSEGTELPLTVHSYPARLEIDYDSNVLTDDQAAAFGRCVRACLSAMASDPRQAMHTGNLIEPSERARLLEDFNATPRPRTLEPLVRAIEARVARRPSADAVSFRGMTLSYQRLNAEANRLARQLFTLGAGPGRVVGICFERSLEMMVAVLATLKTGAAYLPLDPEYPVARLAYMVSEAKPVVVLSTIALRPLITGVRVVALDLPETDAHSWRAFTEDPQADERAFPAPDDPAYVMYTSGSTGQPKGVVITYRGIGNRIRWMLDQFEVGAEDRVLQKTPYSFDASVWELIAPLLVGGVVVLAEPGGHRDPAYLVRTVRDARITILQVVPSLLRLLVEEPGLEACHTLRQVFCAGEVLTRDLVARFARRLDVALCNTYGPTETSIDVTFWRCEADTGSGDTPIGRPIDNTRVFILDRDGTLLPQGVVGELHVAGDGLARGYLNLPGRTAEQFVPCPFGGPDERMYRTGDLARWRPDGALEFVGRVDHQVKIRGVRIETGEIESVLLGNEDVSHAVVVPRERDGATQLVAYVVARAGASQDAAGLRRFLEKAIPRTMLPSSIVFLDAMPLTPSGKIDRAAFPEPAAGPPPASGTDMPRTSLEQVIAEVWQDVLGIEGIPLGVSFFALGGDSLLSLQVVSRLHERGIRLTPRLVFEHDTIERLALVADTAAPASAEQGSVTGPAPLTPAQQWFFELGLARPAHWNQAITLEIPAHWTEAIVRLALARLVAHHDALRLRFGPGEGGWRQWHAPAETADLLHSIRGDYPATVRNAIDRAVEDVQSHLDLSTGPLLRAIHIDRGGRTAGLVLIVHHLAVDEVSWHILTSDLETLCDQIAARSVPTLPRKTTSFQYWATRLLSHAGSGAFESERDHWRTAEARPADRLPRDFEAGTNAESTARDLVVLLDAECTDALLRELPALYRCEITELFLVALATAVREWSGQPSLLVDLEGHGREDLFDDVDLSRTVGWFTSMYPVRIAADPSLPAEERVATARRQLRAVSFHGVGYGVLRYLVDAAPMNGHSWSRQRPDLALNYLGQSTGRSDEELPRRVPSAAGFVRGPDETRTHLLEVSCRVVSGRLEVAWIYSATIHHLSTIERLAHGHLAALRDLVALSRTGPVIARRAGVVPRHLAGQNQPGDLRVQLIEQSNGAART